jgi:uncharacterized membrane protein YidH (DUF202 family)
MSNYRSIPEDEETPGVAGERTDLAWSRSGLAVLAAVGALAKRVLDTRHDVKASFVVGLCLVAGGIAWGLAVAHARVLARTSMEGRIHADAQKLRFVAIGTTALAIGALVLALLPDA